MNKRPKSLRRRVYTTEPTVAEGTRWVPNADGCSTWCRVPLPPTRFGAAALWNPVGVRWIQMEHEMNGCNRAPVLQGALRDPGL